MVWAAALGVALLASAASGAQLPEWEHPKTLTQFNGMFANMARFCSRNFGFTALAVADETTMRDKLNAYLLLAGQPEQREAEWLELVRRWTDQMSKDGPVTQRASEAVGAAVDDPGSYAQAEELYVTTLMNGEQDVLRACSAAARDGYIGQNYISGEGSSRLEEGRLKEEFAHSVAEVRAYKEKIMPRRPRKK